jgi:two-component system, chemotaxis family, protein-glutamate methylesterase/glutaminase
MSKPVRVLVVDDSALMRKMIPQILERDTSIHVVGTAMDGSFGLKKITELRPDVVTIDLDMPRMDGMEMLRQITRIHRIPSIIVSAHSTAGASATFKALALGAFDFVAKPRDAAQANLEAIARELISKVKVAAETGVPKYVAPAVTFQSGVTRVKKSPTRIGAAPAKVIAIGISTGGPNALQYLLSQLPSDFPGAILIVQHMPEGFTEMFARRMNECCSIEVKEARSGDIVSGGRALICPGNRHMRLRRAPLGSMVVLSDEPQVNGHRPSVDVLFRSVALECGTKSLALIMTGMGEDGADAMAAVKSAGGMTLAQDEQSCVVYGMPKAAIERGHVMRVVPLDALANTLIAQCAPERRAQTAEVVQ